MVSKDFNVAASDREFAKMQEDRATLGLLFMDSDETVNLGLANYLLENIILDTNQLLPIYGTSWIDAGRRYKISNSTGGFLGLYNGSARDPVMVCNPITGEFYRVPGNEMNDDRVVVALGNSGKSFKLLRFSFGNFIFDIDPAVISVFTLGTQNWQVVGGGHNFVFVKPHPVCIHGGIYFLATLEHDPPNQVRVVRFNLQTNLFTYLVLPNDSDHPVVSFTRDHTSIGMIDGNLYILKCNWQGGAGNPIGDRANMLVDSNVKVWVFEGGAWNVFIDNVTIPTAYRCPQLFNSPEMEGSYIIYTQNRNRIVVYKGEGVALKRYTLRGERDQRSFIAIQHKPNLLSMNDAMTLLNPIETQRCEKGTADEVMLFRTH